MFICLDIGEELWSSVSEILPDLRELGIQTVVQGNPDSIPTGMESFNKYFDAASDDQPQKSARSEVQMSDSICFIYTSGTTGRSVQQYLCKKYYICKLL